MIIREATKHYVTTEVKQGTNVIVPAVKLYLNIFNKYISTELTTVTANPVTSIQTISLKKQLNSEKERISIIKPEFVDHFVEAIL